VNTTTWRSVLARLHQTPLDPVCQTWLQESQLSFTPSSSVDDIDASLPAHEQAEYLALSLHVPGNTARDALQRRWLDLLQQLLADAVGKPVMLTIVSTPPPERGEREPQETLLAAAQEDLAPTIAGSSSASYASYQQNSHKQHNSYDAEPGLLSIPDDELTQSTLGYMGESTEEWDNEQRANILAHNRLNPRYTFEAFIVGNSNRLAHAASLAVAEAPGESYNPLFLYGGVGLGKTHLLHAIGHQGVQTGLAVLYVSSEQFTNEIVNAIRYRTTEEFRAKYRSVDILLVDDIQFIAGKESTEEEFFHTFNSLHEMSKQIVICSDRPPKAIVSLEERLRSRFEWGLIADIQPPDLETRMAILRVKADLSHYRIPDEIIAYIAGRVQTNIRELEGCLNRLIAYQQLHRTDLTMEVARAAMSSLGNDTRETHLTSRQIAEAVADYYRVSLDSMCGKQRDKHIVMPRQIAMYLIRQETQVSLLEIGQLFGGRDHSTVLHACEKIDREINLNPALRREIIAIREQLLHD
jgi:chromosomal replication initiator protein